MLLRIFTDVIVLFFFDKHAHTLNIRSCCSAKKAYNVTLKVPLLQQFGILHLLRQKAELFRNVLMNVKGFLQVQTSF